MENTSTAFAENTFENIKGTSAVISTEPRKVAWSGVEGCRSFSTPVTVSEAVKAVGADYEVEKRHMVAISDELYRAIMDGTPITETTFNEDDIVPSHCATVRADRGNILGVVGSNYGVANNSMTLDFFNRILNGNNDAGERAVIETAGVLNRGGRFYISAKMPETVQIDGDNSPINDYILLTNDHRGYGGVTVCFTGVRVVCQNTLNVALKLARNKLSYQHTSRIGERMDLSDDMNVARVNQILFEHRSYKLAMVEDLKRLREIRISDQKDVLDLVCRVFADDKEMEAIRNEYYRFDKLDAEVLSQRKKNLIHSLMDSVESGIGQDTNRGTGLWMYNGITTWANNGKQYKDGEKKFDAIWGGDVSRKVQKMHDMVLEYV